MINFVLFETDGINLKTDAAHTAGDTKIMKDEGAEGNTANAFVDEGQGYSIVLSAAEMQAARVVVYVVDAATKVWLDTAVVVETYGNASAMHAFDLDTASSAQTGDNYARLGAPAGASVSADIAAIEAQTDDIGAAGAGLTAVPWNAAWDAEVESEVDDALGGGTGTALTGIPWNAAWDAEVESEVDDALGGGTGTSLTAIPWNASWDAEVQSEAADALTAYDPPTKAEMDTAHALLATPAQVNTEVVDALNVDTYAEPGQEAAPATASLVAKISYLFKAWRNKWEVTATQESLYDDAGTVVDQKRAISDDATTFTKGKIGTGP